MPKIEVNEKLFFSLLGEKYDYAKLEECLTCGKAELDEKPDASLPENERTIKIELNDTNRPDLWSTAGVARQLRLHKGGKKNRYSDFFSRDGKTQDCGNRIVKVDAELKDIRPFMTAFVISGKPIDEPMLLDIIQTQEKLCWNFGRKRRSISMGVYRSANITWPISYKAVDPDKTSFIPLACDKPMTCRQILSDHPKGKEYGWILKDAKKLTASGLKPKAQDLLAVLATDPFQNPPPYEKLVGDLAGAYSRRINIQHRLVYEVFTTERVVRVLRMWTHYE